MIEIAKILKPIGLKGEVKVQMFLKDLSTWQKIKFVTINSCCYEVVNFRVYKGFGYIFFKSIESVEQAESLRNKTIFVNKEELETGDSEFLIEDLISSTIEDEYGNFIGEILDVENYGTADIISYICLGAKRSFPLLKSIIKSFDKKQKKLVVYKQKLDEVVI